MVLTGLKYFLLVKLLEHEGKCCSFIYLTFNVYSLFVCLNNMFDD